MGDGGDYYATTDVWPIMHIIAVQRRVLDANPWIARNLYNAFLESKRRSVERLSDPAVSRELHAWLPAYARKMRDLIDGDPFPYGIERTAQPGAFLPLHLRARHQDWRSRP